MKHSLLKQCLDFSIEYDLKGKNNTLLIIGANRFDQVSGDDLLPYLYLLTQQVNNLILIDGNKNFLNIDRPFIPRCVNQSLVTACALPWRMYEEALVEGIHTTPSDLGEAKYYGSREVVIQRINWLERNTGETSQHLMEHSLLLNPRALANFHSDKIQVDIEGSDVELLLDLFEEKDFSPRIMIFEHHYQHPSILEKIYQIALARNYLKVRHPISPQLNSIFVKSHR